MQPLPYTDAGAKAIMIVAVALLALGELRARLHSHRFQRGVPKEWRSLVVLALSVYLGVLGGFLAAERLQSAAIGLARWELFALGAALTLAGTAFRQWAITVLGESFTVEVRVRPDQPVVDSGPYRRLAHPSYAGLLAAFAGIGLMLGNWVSLACLLVVPAVGLLYRIRVEERFLVGTLGEPYRRFLGSRARLLPGIW